MIDDGDVSAVIASVINSSNIDMYYGIGGAPEGVLAAAALQCLGGSIEGQLIFYNDQEILRAKKTGINDLDKFYSLDDLAHGDICFQQQE
jgi:fructose-1,6-bisphosphatase II / sedoheptulose-1,7-bisphosphatase